jgi:hypothetical protein
MPYEPHDAPDPMTRDGWIALAIIGLACAGVGLVVVAAVHGVAAVIAWVATWWRWV